MRRITYFWMLISLSFFAVGCSQGSSGPEEGSAAEEAAIDDDIGMQEGDMLSDGETEDATGDTAAPE
jgi:hypothetical protein